MENINLILTSTLVAGIVSTFVSYIISIRLKKLDFKNEYYKEILKKRLTAYEYIEAQLGVLKTVVLDETDGKPYHLMFSYGDKEFFDYQKNLLMAISLSLWIDDDTTNSLEKLNELFYNLNIKTHKKSKTEIIEVGKKYYQKISDLRFHLENSTKKGLYNLHNVDKAFKTKNKNTKREIRELK
ncbi:hypothetical protein [Flavobacterium fluvii]|nr:hypothetical protein [Flavobacterium fluvii]